MFDPSSVTVKNGNFMGLPFDEESAQLILLPVPWDVTTSYKEGTCTAPQNILNASYQLDLSHPYVDDVWRKGIYLRRIEEEIWTLNNKFRKKAIEHIDFLESGGKDGQEDVARLQEINDACEHMRDFVKQRTGELLDQGKKVGLLGGEHSTPLGLIQALADRNEGFGVLSIDAHMDLRKSYEGFTYSHASIFHHVSQIPQVSKIVQVGIRDWCEEEEKAVKASDGRIKVFYDHQLKEGRFAGKNFAECCDEIVQSLPEKVYVSFDIDGLDPKLCPHTGTPVPGGLEYQESIYLIHKVLESGRSLIGFDLSEVGGVGNEWDGNVGARVLYSLCGFLL